MAFKISLKRKKTFDYSDSDGSFSVTFDFKYAEDLDKRPLRKKLKEKYKDYKPTNTDKVDDLTEEDIDYLLDASHIALRQQLVSCSELFDEEGNEIVITEPDGEINEYFQKAVFELVKSKPELYKDIFAAYTGVSPKNSKTGVTE